MKKAVLSVLGLCLGGFVFFALVMCSYVSIHEPEPVSVRNELVSETVQIGEMAPGRYFEISRGGRWGNIETVDVLVHDDEHSGNWITKNFLSRVVSFVYDDEKVGTMDVTVATGKAGTALFGDQEVSEVKQVIIYLPETSKGQDSVEEHQPCESDEGV